MLGTSICVSTIGTSFIDLSDVDIIIFEEFMRSAVEKPSKNDLQRIY